MKRSVLITALVTFIALCLGLVAVYGQGRQQRTTYGLQRPDANTAGLLIRLMDLNRDRRISGGEYIQFFASMDQNKDGLITQQEMMADPNKKAADAAKKPQGPGVRRLAPDFTLQTLNGTGEIALSSYRKRRKPVVLVFASYTWQPFRDQAEALEKLYNKYKDRSEWLLVYLREIRPSDSQQVGANTVAETSIGQLETMDDRMAVARASYSQLGVSFPAVVDGLDNKTEETFAAWPNRLYIVNKSGLVAYKSKEEPDGFNLSDIEKALAKVCKN